MTHCAINEAPDHVQKKNLELNP